jgi:hypothetical protein
MRVNPYESPHSSDCARQMRRSTGSLWIKAGLSSIAFGTCLWVFGWIVLVVSTEDYRPFGRIAVGMAAMAFTLIPALSAAFWLIGVILLGMGAYERR